MPLSENPILYRLQCNRRPAWSNYAIYPALVLTPALLLALSGKQDPYALLLTHILILFLHTLYFCGRPLLEAANSLVVEHRRGTFESLQATPLGTQGWVTALLRQHCSPRLGELVCFGWLVGPAVGCSPAQTLGICLYTASCIVFYGSAGLWLSERSDNPTGVQLHAFLLLALTFFLSVPVEWFLRSMPVSQFINPFMVTYTVFGGPPLTPSHIESATLGQLILAALLVLATISNLRVGSRHRAVLHSPLWSKICASIQRPLLYRSLLRAGHDFSLARLLAYPVFLVCMRGITGHHQWIAVSLGLYLAIVGNMVYLTIRALLAGCPALAGEREKRTMESLLSTSLTPQALFWGQWTALILPVLVESVVWSFVWILYCSELAPAALAMLVLYSQVWGLFIGTLALWNSARSSTTSAAFLQTVAVILALSVGTLCADAALFHKFDHFSLLSPIRGLTLLLVGHHWELGLASVGAYLAATALLLLIKAPRLGEFVEHGRGRVLP